MQKKASKDLLNIKLHILDKIVIRCIPFLFIVMTIAMVILVKNFIYRQLDTINKDLKDNSFNISTQITNEIKNKASILDMLTEFPEVYKMNRESQRAFMNGHAHNVGFRNVFFVDNEGFGYYPNTNKLRDQSQEYFFQDIKDSEFFVTDPYYPSGDPFTTIARPIYNKDEKRVGTICGTVPLKTLQLLMARYEASSRGSCFIVNTYGIFIASTDNNLVKQRTEIFKLDNCKLDIIQEVIDNHKSAYGRITLKGKKYFFYAYYLKDFNWILVDCRPASDVLISFIKTCVVFVIFAVSFICVLISLVHILISWQRSNNKIYTDPLCQCGSRAACNAMLEELNKHYDERITLLFADLDRFKEVNDTFGHKAGDEMLLVFSRHLIFVFGDYGYIGRNGGDEFIVFLYNIEDSEVVRLWNELEARLEQASLRLAYDYEILASYGFAVREKGSRESLVDVLKKADNAMYINKAEHKKKQLVH